jgi:hypothetical protein
MLSFYDLTVGTSDDAHGLVPRTQSNRHGLATAQRRLDQRSDLRRNEKNCWRANAGWQNNENIQIIQE